METKKPYKRRIYLIDKKFQLNFIIRFCTVVLIAGLLTIGILYLLAMKSTTVSVVNSRVVVRTTADFLLPLLVQTVIVVTIFASLVTIVLALFYTHKIAGPLYRFKKTLKALEGGDFTTDFHIRHLDQLQDLSAIFNDMIKKLRQEQDQLKTNFFYLKEKLEGISEHEVPEHKRQTLNELKIILQKLDKIVHYFKT